MSMFSDPYITVLLNVKSFSWNLNIAAIILLFIRTYKYAC